VEEFTELENQQETTMKKLMIAAAAAAMIGGAYADGNPQVYDMTITVKTTECKSAGKAYDNACEDDVLLYRNQTTQKFYGKFWGCECDVIACPEVDNYGQPRLADENSYMFWGAKDAFHTADFEWTLLQLVGKKGTNIEGIFGLDLYTCKVVEAAEDEDSEDDTTDLETSLAFSLTGAGYGTATIKACADEANILKSMSGSVVGTYNVTEMTDVSGCKYCGESAGCSPWQFCTCQDVDDDLSAAFGTFTIKYNSSQSKALKNGKWIDQANKFKSFVTSEFACIKANGIADIEDDDGEEADDSKDDSKDAQA
jgi:hypothetical protein